MFCALKGATESPRPLSHAQMAVAIQLLPAFEEVPPTNSERARHPCSLPGTEDASEISRISPTAPV